MERIAAMLERIDALEVALAKTDEAARKAAALSAANSSHERMQNNEKTVTGLREDVTALLDAATT